ncbi:DUF2339 domain-containing protein [Sinirhodobacter sp. WL0062]|uniref:DUF2339 domain-containing protein n=1 Tax=Rhodobacter flavimaris TaxID=2907145 RepID=A0ABS8YRP3_9RHOB|nr:DUF2339 domain-containing protein [Sinirhodobacter sp. WL0062]MCE5972549.1 DUF2339 domain-containing protein [Sinirhodobacter sp. WL0062]
MIIPLIAGFALIATPIVAWIALSRTKRLRDDVSRLKASNAALWAEISALQKSEVRVVKADPQQTEAVRPVADLGEAPAAEIAKEQALPAQENEPDLGLERPEQPPKEAATVGETAVAAKAEETSEIVQGPWNLPAAEPAAQRPARESLPAEYEPPALRAKLMQLAGKFDKPSIPESEAGGQAAPELKPAAKPFIPPQPGLLRRVWGMIFPADTDWETLIGRNWLNIIGIIVLVVGLVLLIQQSLLIVSALGKIAIGVGVSGLLMGCGEYLRRSRKYRVFAFTLVGGGWGLLYFTAFAAYNIEAAQVIDNAYVAMLALLAVAVGIILQSFSYKREVVTGLAYGLAFLALHLSPLSIYSLLATAVLAASIPFVVRRTDWRLLGIVTSVASYATHARWLWATGLPVDAPETQMILGGLVPSQAFWGNIAILCVYWVVFGASVLLSRSDSPRSGIMDLGLTVINTVGFVGLLAWEMETYLPGKLHYAAVPAMTAYVALALADLRLKRYRLTRFNGSMGVALFAGTLPLAIYSEGLSWSWLAPYWAIGGLILWKVVFRFNDLLFRSQADVLLLLATLAACVVNLYPEQPFPGWNILLLGLVPILFAELVVETLHRSAPEARLKADQFAAQVSLLVLPLLGGLAIWLTLPPLNSGLAMVGAGVALLELGAWTRRGYVRVQSYLIGVAGFAVMVVKDIALHSSDETRQVVVGVLIAGAALAYWAALRMRLSSWPLTKQEREGAWVWAAAATTFVAGAVYHWQPIDRVPVGWAIWALVLMEFGQRLRWTAQRVIAYVLFLLSALVGLMLDDTLHPAVIGSSAWHFTALLALLFHVASYRTLRPACDLTVEEKTLSTALLGAGAVFVGLSTWDRLPSGWVAPTWALWAVAVQMIAGSLRKRQPLMVTDMAAIAAFGLSVAVNIYDVFGTLAPATLQNTASLSVVIGALYLYAYRMPRPSTPLGATPFVHLGTLLMALALWRELPSIAVALGWGAMAFGLIEISGRTKFRAFPQQAQMLILAATVRLFFANFVVAGETMGISHRLVSVGAIIALVYYMRVLRLSGWGAGLRLLPAPVFSWIGAALLVILARFEVGREYAVALWSLLILCLALLGMRLKDRDFRYQAYMLCVLVFGRAWATNAYLEGSLFGMSERIVTTLPALVALLFVVILLPRAFKPGEGAPVRSRIVRMLRYADGHARSVVALLFAALLTLLIFYEMAIDLVSIGWAISALALLAMGFALKERSLRLYGLLLLLICLVKVVFYDLDGVEAIYRVISFIVLGFVLLLASLGYSRFRDVLGRYL